MTESFTGQFDGNVIVPDQPLEFAKGQRLQIVARVEDEEDSTASSEADQKKGPFSDLLQFSFDDPNLPTDLSIQHDHYLYGTPKRTPEELKGK